MRRSVAALCLRVLADNTRLDGTFVGSRLVEGTATLPDGRVFTGKFDEASGQPLPDTTLVEDGDFYQGCFNIKWQRHGEGAALLQDGTRYAGMFIDDELKHGIVRVPDASGDVTFTGELKDEQFVKGSLQHPDYIYEGEFKDNQPHGRGVIDFTSGARQEGTFVRGQLHGPDNKMRLESGHHYTGDFVDGRIQSGTLRTATFTYEGDFNEQGMAEGIGRAEYLTMDPRVIFTGRWTMGKMTEGQCEDEYGNPVDYMSQPELRMEVENVGPAAMAADAASRESLANARQNFRSMNDSYVRDSERAAQAGRPSSKMDLGYEGNVDSEMEKRAAAQPSMPTSSDVTHTVHDATVRESTDPAALAAGALRQHGAQQAVASNTSSQFEQFLKSESQDKHLKRGLEIDGNAPWKSSL